MTDEAISRIQIAAQFDDAVEALTTLSMRLSQHRLRYGVDSVAFNAIIGDVKSSLATVLEAGEDFGTTL